MGNTNSARSARVSGTKAGPVLKGTGSKQGSVNNSRALVCDIKFGKAKGA